MTLNKQTNKGSVYVLNTGDEQHKRKKKEELDTSVRLAPQTMFAERSILSAYKHWTVSFKQAFIVAPELLKWTDIKLRTLKIFAVDKYKGSFKHSLPDLFG